VEGLHMRCLNCGKKVPKTAQVCQHCEAAIESAPSKEEEEAVLELLAQMPSEALAELGAVLDESATADEFVDRIFVGDCPKCGSHDTGNCENDPEIEELLVGRCLQCGQLWCTECLRLLEPGSTSWPWGMKNSRRLSGAS
jgi:hypothetical protein